MNPDDTYPRKATEEEMITLIQRLSAPSTSREQIKAMIAATGLMKRAPEIKKPIPSENDPEVVALQTKLSKINL